MAWFGIFELVDVDLVLMVLSGISFLFLIVVLTLFFLTSVVLSASSFAAVVLETFDFLEAVDSGFNRTSFKKTFIFFNVSPFFVFLTY